MGPRDRLRRGQEAAAAGRYADALRDYVWFHEHAIAHQPSLYGVRLSFALWYWIELAAQYPKARQELEKIRNRKTKRLLKGDLDRELFHDVESINEYLKCEAATYELFAKLESKNPDFATRCAPLALPSIVKTRDFAMARRYTPSPLDTLQRYSNSLNRDIEDLARLPPSKAPRLKAYISIYAEQVRLLLQILKGTKERKAVQQVRAQAVELVKSTRVRNAVRKALRAA
jgi:hypothetical protein